MFKNVVLRRVLAVVAGGGIGYVVSWASRCAGTT